VGAALAVGGAADGLPCAPTEWDVANTTETSKMHSAAQNDLFITSSISD
jgi:hypothetical protein